MKTPEFFHVRKILPKHEASKHIAHTHIRQQMYNLLTDGITRDLVKETETEGSPFVTYSIDVVVCTSHEFEALVKREAYRIIKEGQYAFHDEMFRKLEDE